MFDKRVGDVMIPLNEYPYILQGDTLLEAMKKIEGATLTRGGRTSLPRVLLVFGDGDRLVGMVRRRDILKGLEPKFLVKKSLQSRKMMFDAKQNPKMANIEYKKIFKGVWERAERPVMEIMLPIQATVDYYDHIFKAIYEMNQFGLSQLPVLKEGQVVGIVRTVDVFNEVAEELLKEDYIW